MDLTTNRILFDSYLNGQFERRTSPSVIGSLFEVLKKLQNAGDFEFDFDFNSKLINFMLRRGIERFPPPLLYMGMII